MSDHWKDQPRQPKGIPEGGEWTDDPGVGYPTYKWKPLEEQDTPYPGSEEDEAEKLAKMAQAAREGAGLPKKQEFPEEFTYPSDQMLQEKYQELEDEVGDSGDIVEAENYLQQRVDEGEVWVNTPPEAAWSVLYDGRFKTQFETGRSQGAYDPNLREVAESNAFGYGAELDPKKRPVYGHVADPEKAKKYFPVPNYGEIAWVLKDTVKQRSTVSWDDSLSGFLAERFFASPAENVNVGAFEDFWDIQEAKRGDVPYYIEAQIHGGLGLDDVLKVVISRRRVEGDPDIIDFVAELDRLGIPWETTEY